MNNQTQAGTNNTAASGLKTATGSFPQYSSGPINIEVDFHPTMIIASVAIPAVNMPYHMSVYNARTSLIGAENTRVIVDRYRNASYQVDFDATPTEHGIVNWTPFEVSEDLGDVELTWIAYGE